MRDDAIFELVAQVRVPPSFSLSCLSHDKVGDYFTLAYCLESTSTSTQTQTQPSRLYSVQNTILPTSIKSQTCLLPITTSRPQLATSTALETRDPGSLKRKRSRITLHLVCCFLHAHPINCMTLSFCMSSSKAPGLLLSLFWKRTKAASSDSRRL